MRVAIVHYWLVGMRGGERVLEQLCLMFPDADIYTHVCDREKLSPLLRRHRIRETFIARLPGAKKHYQKYLPLMPYALEQLDLSSYDLVLSSESGPAKGVICNPDTPHLCYTHSPMRYIWDQYHAYREGLNWPMRMLWTVVSHKLRIWDVAAANRVDRYVANSSFVARRVMRCWGREADVVHPPVDLEAYRPAPAPGADAPSLFLSALVPYKRADLAIEACKLLGRRLKIVGSGSEMERLKKLAGPGVEFLGRVPDGEMRALYHSCRALLFPGVEDFGIVPLEAMACGRPVLAYGRGGALDTVKEGVSGLLFDAQTAESLAEAMRRFETEMEPSLDPERVAAHAQSFGPGQFRAGMWSAIRRMAPELGLPEEPPAIAQAA